MDILEIRRQHLRKLMKDMGGTELALALGYRQSSFLSQMAGPNPTRGITEKTARAYETALNLAHGYLDTPIPSDTDAPPQAPSQMTTVDMLTMVLTATRKVGNICEAEKVDLPPSKFASLLQIVLKEAADHGGVVREDHGKDVLELLK